MPGIGETLREARMRQGIDVAEVESRTKIRAKYLRALENDEFGLLPGPTFVRSFLRTYAEYLGLDASLLIEEFRSRYEPPDELEPLQPLGAAPTRRGGSRDRGPRRPSIGGPSPGVVLAGVVLLVLAVLLIVGLTGGSGGDKKGSATTEASAKQRKADRVRRRAARSRRAAAQRRAAAKPDRVTLRITPVDSTYICVDKGEGTAKVFEGPIDGPRTFKGKTVRINLGKRTPVLKVNGKTVVIEQNGQPIGFEFKPGKRKELPAGQRPCS